MTSKQAKSLLALATCGLFVATELFASSILGSLDLDSLIGSDGTPYGFSLVTIFLILIAVFAIGLISSEFFPNGPVARLSGKLCASKLFLRVSFQFLEKEPVVRPTFATENPIASASGYLRVLGFDHAEIVSDTPLRVGTPVRINLSSLPNFTGGTVFIDGEVVSSTPVKGSRTSSEIKVRFATLTEKAKEPLQAYLKFLLAA